MQGYTRRQLKEDRFAQSTQGAVHWAVEHRQTMFWVIGLLVVATAAVIGLLTWNSRQSDQANIELSKAMRTFTAPLRPAGTPPQPNDPTPSFTSISERSKQAEKEFSAVAERYPHTKPGKVAAYLAGTAALQSGDNADAEKRLKSAAEGGDSDVAALAKMALANVYRATNRNADAAKLYKEISDHPANTVSKPEAELALAEMYESSDPKEAANIYQKIQKENPNTAAAQIAGSKLATASGK